MANESSKYCEDYLLRKEGRNKWIQYWVVIRGVWMLFYRDQATTNRDNFKGSVELTSCTKCNTARRGNYSFPFFVVTARGTHLFKCDTNLKRHQWMYLIGLAAKGDTPAPPPLAVPSPLSSSTALNSHDAEVNHAEICRQNSESDEDDFSIPPGVILVTTPIEELSHDEKTSNGHTSAIQGQVQHDNLSKAVLTTGITGATRVVREPSSTKASAPQPVTRPFQSTTGVSPCQLKYFPIGLSPPSAISWGRSSPDRPSSSPSLNHTRRHLGTKQLARSPLTNNRFSRYMAKSVPDMKILSLEDPS